MTTTILIVDDDPVQRRLLDAMIRRFGYEVRMAENGEDALKLLTGPDGEGIDSVVLDLVMPGLDGMGVLAALRDKGVTTPVIVQTAHGSIDAVVAAMRAGAADFVVKPVGAERLQVSIKNTLKVGALEDEVRRMRRRVSGTMTLKDMMSKSPDMLRVVRLAERAAKSGIPVLVEGESGVGKEVLARVIQGSGERKGKPFITVNCGAIPENLVESTLFGHEKGSFTGATERHLGKFIDANGGTLFLDEIGELPLDAQVKLLRALQEGEVDPVGARKPVRVDIRIISATNKSLLDLVKQGKFREDLYYRLNVFPILMPPLRARRDDIADLARSFAARFAAEEGKKIRGLSAEALALIATYDWPGNVRQLENAMFDVRIPAAPQPVSSGPLQETRIIQVPMRDPYALDLLEGNDMRQLDAMEKDIIKFALDHYRGHMSEVSRKLGIGRSTLYRKLKDYGLDGDLTGEAESNAA
jgi:DNA-binding NtrC family response regulator